MSEVLEFVIEGKDEFSHIFEKLLHSVPVLGEFAAAASIALIGLNVALFKITEKAGEAGDHIYQMALRLGMSVEFIQGLRHAAEMADVPIEQMERSLSRLAVNISEATYKAGPARDAFNDLGISLFDTSGKMKTVQDVLPEVADGLLKIGSSSRQAETAGALFGQRSIEMIQLLKQGGEGFKEAAEQARKFGVVMDTQAIANAHKFNDVMKEADAAITGVRNAIAEKLMPIFAGMVESFTEWISENRGTIAAWAESGVRAMVYLYEVTRRIFVVLRQVTLTVWNEVAEITNKVLSKINTWFQENPQVIKDWASAAVTIFYSVEAEIMRLSMLLDKIGGTLTSAGMLLFAPGAALGIENSVKQFEKLAAANIEFEERYKQTDKALQDLANNLNKKLEDIQNSTTPIAKAFEGLRTSMKDFFGEDIFASLSDSVDKIIKDLFKMGSASTEALTKIKTNTIDTVARLKSIWTDWFGSWTTGMQDLQALSKQTWASFSQGIGDAVGQAIIYGKNLHDAFTQLWKSIAAAAISALVQIGIKQMMQAMITKAITTGEATTKMSAYSMETYAGVYAANASIPYIGPYIAAGEAAAAVAAMLAGAETSAALGAAAGGSVGIAHGGLTNVPNEETYLLQKGERVLSPNQNEDLTGYLQKQGGGSGTGSVVIQKIEVINPMMNANWDTVMEKQLIPALNRAIKRNVYVEGR